MEQLQELLSGQDASSSNCLDFLLGSAREEPGLDNNWLLGKNTFTQNLNNFDLLVSLILGAFPRLFERLRLQKVLMNYYRWNTRYDFSQNENIALLW